MEAPLELDKLIFIVSLLLVSRVRYAWLQRKLMNYKS